MKRILILTALALLVSTGAQAQTWDYFFHHRPAIERAVLGPDNVPRATLAPASPFIYAFVPSFHVIATAVRFSNDPSKSLVTSVLNGVGPGLTLAHMGQNADGSNYADWTATLSVIPSMDPQYDPNFQPMIALEAGVLNSLLNIGVGLDINKRIDTKSQVCIFFSLAVLPTLN